MLLQVPASHQGLCQCCGWQQYSSTWQRSRTMPGNKPKSAMQESESLCKRSTRIAVNIVRLSSLCLARITLLPLDPGKQRRRRAADPTDMGTAAEADADVAPWEGEGIGRSSWESRSSPASYLLESPLEKKKRAQVVREDDAGNVNERAENYISKIRRSRSLHDVAARAPDPAKVIPPPPRRPPLPYGRGGS